MNYDPFPSPHTTESGLLTVPADTPREDFEAPVPSNSKGKPLEVLSLPRGPILRQESHRYVNPNSNKEIPDSGALKNALEMTATLSANSEEKTDINKRTPTSILKSSHPGTITKKSTVVIDPSVEHMDISIEHVNNLPHMHSDKKESHSTIMGSMQRLKSLFVKEKTIPSIKSIDLDFEFESGDTLPQSKVDQLELLNRNLNFWESEEEKISKVKTRDRKNSKNPIQRKRESAVLTPRSVARRNLWRRIKSAIVNRFKATYVFKPDGRFKISWDMLGMLFILYELLMIPLSISFTFESSEVNTLELIIDIFFLVDIVMTFNTGYYERGHLIVDRKKIVVTYLRKWFWIDLVASFPYSRAMSTPDNADSESNTDLLRQSTRIIRIIRFVRFVRVIRLIRIFKLRNIFGKLDNFISLSPALNSITGFLRLSAIILFIAHWIACFWHLIGDSETAYETWLTRLNLQDAGWKSRYLASIYWAVTTMITVGYGDIVPVTDNERIYTLFTMLIASAVFAYSMNNINALLASIDAERQEFKETIVWVKRYMRKMKLDPGTRAKVTKYLEYTLIEAKYRKDDEARLLNLLSDSLKDEVVKKINEGVLNVCDSLKKTLKRTFSEVFIIEMTYFFSERVYSPSEQIFTEGDDDALCLYMINSGPVKTVLSSSKELVLQTYGRGDYFGELEFFTGMNRRWNAKAGEDFVSLFSLKRKDFLALVANFSRDKERFFQIKDKLLLYNDYSNLELKCNYCRRPPHFPLECPAMHHVIDRTKFLKEQISQNNRFRSSFTRHSKRTQGKNPQRLELCALRIRANLAKEIEALENEEPNYDFYHASSIRTEEFTHRRTNDFNTTTRDIDTGIKSISDLDPDEVRKPDFIRGKLRKATRRTSKKEVILESGIDAVYSYKEYFTHNNIENILKRVNENFVQRMKVKRMKILKRIVRVALMFQKPKTQIKIKINPPPQTSSSQSVQPGVAYNTPTRDMASLKGIPEAVEFDTSMNEKIAEEQVNFNKKENWANEEFTKTMNFKLMLTSPKEDESLEESSYLVGDFMNAGSDPEIEDKLKSYPELNENDEAKEEVNTMLDRMIAKYGSEYIQKILSQK